MNGHFDAGGVNVVYGSATGLTATGNQFWTETSPGVPGATAVGDQFGFAVATGDLNGDGYADLAIGGPTKASPGENAGAVVVLWSVDVGGMRGQAHPGDLFGFSLVGGDFNGDGFGDLAIGVPGEGPPQSAGAVSVVYGSTAGLSSAGNQLWTENSPGVRDVAEPFDIFGYSLAVGTFDGKGFSDLAIGVPFEDIGTVANAGGVNVLYGSPNGLTAAGNQFWSQAGADPELSGTGR